MASWVLRIFVVLASLSKEWYNSMCRKRPRQEVEEEFVAVNGGDEPNNVQTAEQQQRKRPRTEKHVDNGVCRVTENVSDESNAVEIAKAYMARNKVQPWNNPYVRNSHQLARHPLVSADSLFRDVPTAQQLRTRTTIGELFGNRRVEDRSKTLSNRLSGLQHRRVQPLKCTHYVKNSARHHMHIGDGIPISTTESQWTKIQFPPTAGGQMLKKRSSSVLDGGLTLGGPIRSTRQKTSFYNPWSNFNQFCSTSYQLNSLSLHANKSRQSVPSTFESHVPRQSTETARKILEHLERIKQFPKEKSLKAQLAIARAESSGLNMNDDNAASSSNVLSTSRVSTPTLDDVSNNATGDVALHCFDVHTKSNDIKGKSIVDIW